MTPPAKCRWAVNGQPANLEAAAQDALEWLIVLRDNPQLRRWLTANGDASERLGRAIAALEPFLKEETS